MPPSADAVRVGPEGKPKHTLALDVVVWAHEHLRLPDGPSAGERWRFTPEQLRFLAWWYAVDDAGRWIYRRGTLRRMKGWGKDPLGSVLCAVEAIGPCRFGGWDANGHPVAIPHPAGWVQVAAVSREQTRTTMRLFPAMFPKATRERFGIDVNKEVIYFKGGTSVIEAVTSSPKSAEGPRATFVLRNEVQWWVAANDGHAMAETIDGNLAKSRDGSARALSLCNAHIPGQDSIGEREWDAWQAIAQGRTRATGVLYDSLEAPPDTDLRDETSLRRGLEAARGDATWLDIERLVAEVYDPRTPPAESRRKYLNQVIAAEDAWVAPHEWDALADAGLALEEGDEVTLGFDGAKTDDHCALIATRVEDGAMFTLGVWDPAEYGGEAPRELIDGTIRNAFGRYDVVGFFSDMAGWESYVDRWADELGAKLVVKAGPRHAVAWDMRGRGKELTTEGVERLHDEITERAFRHDGDARTRQHVHNARRRPNAWGVSFGKEHRESLRKVDAVAAAVLSRMARRAYLALPPSRRRRRRSGRAAFA